MTLAVDWAAIEIDYRAGVKSLRVISETHGLTEGAIRARAKRDGWTRPMAKALSERMTKVGAASRKKPEVKLRAEPLRNSIDVRNSIDDQIIARANLTLDRYDAELVRLLAFHPRGLYDAAGNMLHPRDWPEEVAARMSGFDVVRRPNGDEVVKVRWIKLTEVLALIAKRVDAEQGADHLVETLEQMVLAAGRVAEKRRVDESRTIDVEAAHDEGE